MERHSIAAGVLVQVLILLLINNVHSLTVTVTTAASSTPTTMTTTAGVTKTMSKCERGVKRHHPSQANLYQVFTRNNYRKQWLDMECDGYMIFDPRLCECVDNWTSQSDRKDSELSQGLGRKSIKRRWKEEDSHDHDDDEFKGGERANKWKLKQKTRQSRKRQEVKTRLEKSEKIRKSNWKDEAQDKIFDEDNSVSEEEGCFLHRSSPSSPSHFERWTDGHWEGEDCNWPFYTGLVWSQDSCRCEWGPNRTQAQPRLENSVPASCLMMLRLTFDEGQIKDDGRGIWLKVVNKDDAIVESDDTAVGGYSASFRGASIQVPYFKSNVLGSIFHIGLMFKLCPGDPDTGITIVHNSCEVSREGASLVVTYQAWNQEMIVGMKTVDTYKLLEDHCFIRNPDSKGGWIQMDLRYEDNYLELTVNGEVCLESDKYYGQLATNNCPLTLLGDSFCGKLDEVIITRGCTEAHAIN